MDAAQKEQVLAQIAKAAEAVDDLRYYMEQMEAEASGNWELLLGTPATFLRRAGHALEDLVGAPRI